MAHAPHEVMHFDYILHHVLNLFPNAIFDETDTGELTISTGYTSMGDEKLGMYAPIEENSHA